MIVRNFTVLPRCVTLNRRSTHDPSFSQSAFILASNRSALGASQAEPVNCQGLPSGARSADLRAGAAVCTPKIAVTRIPQRQPFDALGDLLRARRGRSRDTPTHTSREPAEDGGTPDAASIRLPPPLQGRVALLRWSRDFLRSPLPARGCSTPDRRQPRLSWVVSSRNTSPRPAPAPHLCRFQRHHLAWLMFHPLQTASAVSRWS